MDKVWIKLCLLLPVKCDSINNVFFLRISGFVQRPFNWFMMMCPVEPSRALLRGGSLSASRVDRCGLAPVPTKVRLYEA